MTEKITPETARYIADLARIHLREKEVALLAGNLADILNYIKKLEELDVSQVEPTSHVLPLSNVFRPDDLKPSLSQAEVLKFAVARQDGTFKVPLVIE